MTSAEQSFRQLVAEVGETQVGLMLDAVLTANVEAASQAARIVADELATLRAAKASPTADQGAGRGSIAP